MRPLNGPPSHSEAPAPCVEASIALSGGCLGGWRRSCSHAWRRSPRAGCAGLGEVEEGCDRCRSQGTLRPCTTLRRMQWRLLFLVNRWRQSMCLVSRAFAQSLAIRPTRRMWVAVSRHSYRALTMRCSLRPMAPRFSAGYMCTVFDCSKVKVTPTSVASLCSRNGASKASARHCYVAVKFGLRKIFMTRSVCVRACIVMKRTCSMKRWATNAAKPVLCSSALHAASSEPPVPLERAGSGRPARFIRAARQRVRATTDAVADRARSLDRASNTPRRADVVQVWSAAHRGSCTACVGHRRRR